MSDRLPPIHLSGSRPNSRQILQGPPLRLLTTPASQDEVLTSQSEQHHVEVLTSQYEQHHVEISPLQATQQRLIRAIDYRHYFVYLCELIEKNKIQYNHLSGTIFDEIDYYEKILTTFDEIAEMSNKYPNISVQSRMEVFKNSHLKFCHKLSDLYFTRLKDHECCEYFVKSIALSEKIRELDRDLGRIVDLQPFKFNEFLRDINHELYRLETHSSNVDLYYGVYKYAKTELEKFEALNDDPFYKVTMIRLYYHLWKRHSQSKYAKMVEEFINNIKDEYISPYFIFLTTAYYDQIFQPFWRI